MKNTRYLLAAFVSMFLLSAAGLVPIWQPRIMVPVTQYALPIPPNAQTGPGTAVEQLDASTLRIYFTSDDIPTVMSPGQYDICYVDFDVVSETFGMAHDIDHVSSDSINTLGHDQGPSISPDGNYLFFLRLGSGGSHDHEIWMAEKDVDGKWSNPHRLPSTINSGYDEHTGSYRDGKMYFSANSRDGSGNFDIWVCDFDPETEDATNFHKVVFDSWSSDTIDETGPFITPGGGRLYFSAYAPPMIASHDIYYSDWMDLGGGVWGWSEPQALSSNVNGSGNEVTPSLSEDQKYLFFTSTSAPAITNRMFFCEKQEDVATVLRDYNLELDNGSVTIKWTLNEAGANMKFFLLRARLGSGIFKVLSSPVIENIGFTYTCSDESCKPGVSYQYRVEVLDENGRRILFETDFIVVPDMPLTLYQNYPNPFNPATRIRYYLPREIHVVLEIFDVRGRRIARLVDKKQPKGHYSVEWEGRGQYGARVSSGIYFYRLKSEEKTITRKMALLK